MAREVSISLIDPIMGHHGPVTSITLREPKAADVFALGEIQVASRTPDGSTIYLDREEVYERYLEKLLVPGKDGAIEVAAQISLADGYQVRQVINDFFSQAQQKAYERLRSSSSGKPGA